MIIPSAFSESFFLLSILEVKFAILTHKLPSSHIQLSELPTPLDFSNTSHSFQVCHCKGKHLTDLLYLPFYKI